MTRKRPRPGGKTARRRPKNALSGPRTKNPPGGPKRLSGGFFHAHWSRRKRPTGSGRIPRPPSEVFGKRTEYASGSGLNTGSATPSDRSGDVIEKRSAVAPPPRKFWVGDARPTERLTALLVEEVEGLLRLRVGEAAESLRGFLRTFSKLSGDGNPLNVRVGIAKAAKGAGVIYLYIEGSGPIMWAPALVIPWHARITRYLKECGKLPLHTYEVEKEKASDGDEPGRGGGPPKIKIGLYKPTG